MDQVWSDCIQQFRDLPGFPAEAEQSPEAARFVNEMERLILPLDGLGEALVSRDDDPMEFAGCIAGEGRGKLRQPRGIMSCRGWDRQFIDGVQRIVGEDGDPHRDSWRLTAAAHSGKPPMPESEFCIKAWSDPGPGASTSFYFVGDRGAAARGDVTGSRDLPWAAGDFRFPAFRDDFRGGERRV